MAQKDMAAPAVVELVRDKLHPLETHIRLMLASATLEGFTLTGMDIAAIAGALLHHLKDAYLALYQAVPGQKPVLLITTRRQS